MADLNTKSLDEYPTIEETTDGDTVLIERDGRIKRLSASNVGGKAFYLDTNVESNYGTTTIFSVSNEKFNALLEALDNFMPVYLTTFYSSDIPAYSLVTYFSYRHDSTTDSHDISINNYINISPTSETGLYVPQNIMVYEMTSVVDPVT